MIRLSAPPVFATKSLIRAVAILLPGLISLAVTVPVAVHDPLWLDELHTAWVVAGPWSELPSRAGQGNQTSLYFALVKVIGTMTGLRAPAAEGDAWPIALRALSWISAAAVASLIAGELIKQTGSSLLGAAVAVALVFQPTFLFFATEARPYAWVAFLIVSQLVFLMDFVRLGNRDRLASHSFEDRLASKRLTLTALGWTILAFAALASHATAIFAVGTQLVFAFVVIVRWSDRRVGTRVWLVSVFATGPMVAVAAASSQWFAVHNRSELWRAYFPSPSVRTLVADSGLGLWTAGLLGGALCGLVVHLIVRWYRSRQRSPISDSKPHPPTLATTETPPRHASQRGHSQRNLPLSGVDLVRDSLLVMIVAMASILGPAALAWTGVAPLYHPRYILSGLVCLPLGVTLFSVAVVGWSQKRIDGGFNALIRIQPRTISTRASRVVLMGLGIGPLALTVGTGTVLRSYVAWRQTPTGRNEPWEQLSRHLQESDPQPDVVVLAPGLLEEADVSIVQNSSSQKMAAYLTFPLQGPYQASPRTPVLPLVMVVSPNDPITATRGELQAMRSTVIAAQSGVLVVRGRAAVVSDTLTHFQVWLDQARRDGPRKGQPNPNPAFEPPRAVPVVWEPPLRWRQLTLVRWSRPTTSSRTPIEDQMTP